jgi:hypothetical protein
MKRKLFYVHLNIVFEAFWPFDEHKMNMVYRFLAYLEGFYVHVSYAAGASGVCVII